MPLKYRMKSWILYTLYVISLWWKLRTVMVNLIVYHSNIDIFPVPYSCQNFSLVLSNDTNLYSSFITLLGNSLSFHFIAWQFMREIQIYLFFPIFFFFSYPSLIVTTVMKLSQAQNLKNIPKYANNLLCWLSNLELFSLGCRWNQRSETY